MTRIVLDRIAELGVDEEDLVHRRNELQTLQYLWQGLEFINGQVKRLEAEADERLGGPAVRSFSFGNDPRLASLPFGLIASSFHWYAVSACNYARLVGWLGHGNMTKRAQSYVVYALPEVKVWRDKVGAHFAITDPRKHDTPATLAASVMFPVGFDDGRFRTSPLRFAMTAKGVASTSAIPRWSVTEVHDSLKARYRAAP